MHRTHPNNPTNAVFLKNLLKEAAGTGKVLTDLQEIFQASLDDRGELLIINNDFS